MGVAARFDRLLDMNVIRARLGAVIILVVGLVVGIGQWGADTSLC